ncbi:hypothetical protein XELAEV_18038297mg [Pelobates cultripes]|uniref:LRRCT domain-containing protein n=2 Tax=Pelobates cultripes TaxID=61616 RepID=A0AAD1T4Z5_PELCU|nr:hypothetical protein XELAEV_18038297mg [Pelobates cultripes]
MIILCGFVRDSISTCLKNNDQHICDTLEYDGESGIQSIVFVLSNIEELNSTSFSNPKLKSVKSLTLGGNKIRRIELGSFKGFPRMTSLLISNNELRTVQPSWFYNSTLLETLNITSSKIQVVEPQMLAGFSALKLLNFKNNTIKKIGSGSFNDLSKLTYLDLSSNELPYLDWRVVSHLQNATFRFDGNPWNCTCILKDFSLFLQELTNTSRLDEAKNVTCHNPPALHGTPVWDVNFANCSSSSLDEIPAAVFNQIVLPALLVLLGGLFFFMTLWTIVCFLAKCWKNKVANVTDERPETDWDHGKNSAEKVHTNLPTVSMMSRHNLTNVMDKQHSSVLEKQTDRAQCALGKSKDYYENPGRGLLINIMESVPKDPVENLNTLKNCELFFESEFKFSNRHGGALFSKCSSSPGLIPVNEKFTDFKNSAMYNLKDPTDTSVSRVLNNTNDICLKEPNLSSAEEESHSPIGLELQTSDNVNRLNLQEGKANNIGDIVDSETDFEKYVETHVESSRLAPTAFNIMENSGEDTKSQNSGTLNRRCKTWNNFSSISKNYNKMENEFAQESGNSENALHGKLVFLKNKELKYFEDHKSPECFRSFGQNQTSKYSDSQDEFVHFHWPKLEKASINHDTVSQPDPTLEDDTRNVDVNVSFSPLCQLGYESISGKHADKEYITSLNQTQTFGSESGSTNDDHLPKICTKNIKPCTSFQKNIATTEKRKETFPIIPNITEKERFWKHHANCCDESKTCPTAQNILKQLKTMSNEHLSMGSVQKPPSDEDLLEEQVSLPTLSSENAGYPLVQPAMYRQKNYASLPDLNIFPEKKSQGCMDFNTAGPVTVTNNQKLDDYIKNGKSNFETHDLKSGSQILNTFEEHPKSREGAASSSISLRKTEPQIIINNCHGSGTSSWTSIISTKSASISEVKADDENEKVVDQTPLCNNYQKLSKVAFCDNHLDTQTHLLHSVPESTNVHCNNEAADMKSNQTVYTPCATNNTVSDTVVTEACDIKPSSENASVNSSELLCVENGDNTRKLSLTLHNVPGLSSDVVEPVQHNNILEQHDQEIPEEFIFGQQEIENRFDNHPELDPDGLSCLLHIEPVDYKTAINLNSNPRSYNNGDPTNAVATFNLNRPIANIHTDGVNERNVMCDNVQSCNADINIVKNNADHFTGREATSKHYGGYHLDSAVTNVSAAGQQIGNIPTGQRSQSRKLNGNRLQKDQEYKMKLGNKVSPLSPLDEENNVDLTDYRSAKLSKKAYHSIFSISMNMSQLEDHKEEEQNIAHLEDKNSIQDSKRLKISMNLAGHDSQDELTYNDTKVINSDEMNPLEYINYLYTRKLKPFHDLFGGAGKIDHKTNELSVLSNLHFCKVAGKVQFGPETTEPVASVQEDDAGPIIVSLHSDCGYLPPTKQELSADSELAVLNIMKTLKKSLDLPAMCNEASVTK